MEFTTHFELQSQATRLVESTFKNCQPEAQTGVSPTLLPYSKELIPRRQSMALLQTTIRRLSFLSADSA